MQTLNSLSLGLWISRNAVRNDPRSVEKRGNLSRAIHALRFRVRFGPISANAKPQRAALNRRQLRAQSEGVSVWVESIVCGEVWLSRKW